MAISFKVPSEPAKSILKISTFLGVDFSNSPANVTETRSPSSINMVRSVPGKVRKALGYHTVDTFPDQINGIHIFGEHKIIHSGAKYYLDDSETLLYSSGKDAKSSSWELDSENLYIADGTKFLVYDGTTLEPVENDATIPTLTIGKAPSGGGTDYEPINLLQPGYKDSFLGTTSDTEYQLTFGDLDATAVTAKIMDSNGDWVDKAETTDFTVDRTTGIVSFLAAPGESPITGEDNVEILAYRTVTGYADRINKCDIGISFGVNGMQDRLFLSGNTDFSNQDWYSQQNDITYFGDTNYSALGSSASEIICYSILSNRLVTHKANSEQEQNVIIRSGDLVDGEAAFPVYTALHGVGSVSKHGVGYITTEPLFLTQNGIYAITSQDLTGEKYTQSRSFFLDGKLLEESNLSEAYACIHNDMYILALNSQLYILDGLQPVQTDKSAPYSTRQYAAFYRNNVDARVIVSKDGVMYFGTSTGKYCVFYTDAEDQTSYNDDGEPIVCTWETPDLDGTYFYKNKSLRYIAVKLQAAVATSLNIYANVRGLWSLIKTDTTTARYFSFAQFSFSKFTFSSDQTQKIISSKLRIKKVDKTRVKLTNELLNEPFELFDIAIEYVENGNYKGG